MLVTVMALAGVLATAALPTLKGVNCPQKLASWKFFLVDYKSKL